MALKSPVEPAKDVRLTGAPVTADALPKLGKPGTVVSRQKLPDIGIEMINFSNGVKLSLFANSAEKEKIRVNVRFGHGYQAFSPGKPVPSWAGNYALMASGVGEQIGRHTSELQSLMRISYAVFCLKKKKTISYTTV